MFEGLVRQLILGYLGQYIKDIQTEQLKITLWNEEVLLENVELILEAFDYLRLPFAFRQGRVGKLSIKIPWKKLGWDPIIIILEDVYICVSQRDDKEWCTDAVERREYASKKAQLAAAELAKLSRRVCDNQTGKSFISYITAKILDSIQVSIRNVHVLYCDTLSATEEILFGLKFSSLTIMRQTAVGSSIAKVRGGQVNKLIEVQSLELYCDTSRQTDDSNTENGMSYKNMGKERLEDDKYSSILGPLNVSVSLSVNRSGKLLNDAPQYTINVELGCVATSMDDVELQRILSLCDYMSLCQLREKYGRYRPWWSPLGKRLKGWQKAWWHYAQECVLSDVRRRFRKTSWKYFGERLNSRRKYVNLYKAKLKCLRHDQVIEEDIQHKLEEMEKETDIDDILNYRSVAEHELEDFLVNPSSRYRSNDGNSDKSVEDDRASGKPRGWLNWLSYGMLGAGGTDDSNQFSGVISDDVIKDIYEATKFHPAPVLFGDSAAVDEVYFSSVKINIQEIRTTFQSMWVFTLKYKPDGTIDRYKARLVAKGFTQTYGIDYLETFSPVARLNSIRVLFSLAINRDWPMYQLDVKNAFLYGDLHETVFMEQPPGYVAQGESQDMVCKLKKAIYGLKQSPRAWFEKFSRVVCDFGFRQCQSDHSVFVRHGRTGIIILVVYVDDILISGSDFDGIEQTKAYLQQHFVTKDMGRPKYFLGIEIAHSKNGVSLSQRKYALDLLQETGLLGTKPVDTPMDLTSALWDDSCDYLVDKAKYRRLVGKLIYLTVTRPDISFAVGIISQFMDNPRTVHWDAALRILKYIKASPGKGLLFKKNGHLNIEAYSDADYAGSKNDRKSTSGYCTFVGGNLVTWRCKKQTTVARSSAEAEYRAMAHTVSEMLWLKNLLVELGFKFNDPLPMYCDNQAAIHIASNPVFHERTKHIEVDCHFIREAVMSKKICTPFTPSSEQIADIFTKALGGKQFKSLCNKLGMIDIYAPA